jgi:hypothetical protein
MSRGTIAITLLCVASISSIASLAGDKSEAPRGTVESITFSASKSQAGPAIKVTVGGLSFLTPHLIFHSADKKTEQNVVIRDGLLIFDNSKEQCAFSCKALTLNLPLPKNPN